MFEKIVVENFSIIGKVIVTQVQEAQRVPFRIIPSKRTLRHISIILTIIKCKGKILKVTREKQIVIY